RHAVLQPLLGGSHAELLGSEQAFELFTRIDQSLGPNDALLIDQDGVGQLADLKAHADLGGKHVGEVFQAGLAVESQVLGHFAIAGQHDVQPGTFSPRHRLQDGQQLLAHWASGGHEKEQLTASASVTDAQGTAQQVIEFESGGSGTHCRPLVDRQCSHWSDPLVQDADLPGQGQHHQQQGQCHDPQYDIGYDQCRHDWLLLRISTWDASN